MIKNINHQNFLTTPFVAYKSWQLYNNNSDELVILEPTSSEDTVALEFLDYSSGTGSFVNTECSIALEQQSEDLAKFQEGKTGSGIFYPEIEEQNADGTFKRLIYSQIKSAFYNSYKNPIQIFGVENIDFPLSQTFRDLSSQIRIFTIPRQVFGEKLIENSVQLNDTSLDDNIKIKDDGYQNLIAHSNIFSKIQEIRNFGNNIFFGTSSYLCYTSSSGVVCLTLDSSFTLTPVVDTSYTNVTYITPATDASTNRIVVSDYGFHLTDGNRRIRNTWFVDTTTNTTLNVYTSSNIHFQSNKNALYAISNGTKSFYAMNDGTGSPDFTNTLSPVHSLLKFSSNGQLISTITMSFTGIVDFTNSSGSLWLFNRSGSNSLIQQYNPNTDTIISSRTIGNYTGNFIGNGVYEYSWGTINSSNDVTNNVYQLYVTAISGSDIVDVFNIENGNFNHVGSLNLTDGVTYGGWTGGIAYASINQKIYIGVYGPNPDYSPWILEVNSSTLNVDAIIDLSPMTASLTGFPNANTIVYNPVSTALVVMGLSGPIVVINPITHELVCGLDVNFWGGLGLSAGPSGGTIYAATYQDTAGSATGSIRIYNPIHFPTITSYDILLAAQGTSSIPQINLSWSYGGSPANYFSLQRSLDSGASWGYSIQLNITSSSYIDTINSGSGTYYYRLAAVTSTLTQSYSNVVTTSIVFIEDTFASYTANINAYTLPTMNGGTGWNGNGYLSSSTAISLTALEPMTGYPLGPATSSQMNGGTGWDTGSIFT